MLRETMLRKRTNLDHFNLMLNEQQLPKSLFFNFTRMQSSSLEGF
jgi:hypothetical protein